MSVSSLCIWKTALRNSTTHAIVYSRGKHYTASRLQTAIMSKAEVCDTPYLREWVLCGIRCLFSVKVFHLSTFCNVVLPCALVYLALVKVEKFTRTIFLVFCPAAFIAVFHWLQQEAKTEHDRGKSEPRGDRHLGCCLEALAFELRITVLEAKIPVPANSGVWDEKRRCRVHTVYTRYPVEVGE